MLSLFRNARFRLLWISGAFNDLGIVMYFMVHGWLALAVTDSPFWVGATAGVGGLGLVSFRVFGGVLVDRLDRRNLILVSLLVQTVVMFALVFLIFTDQVRLWHILAASFLDAAVVPFKVPARMALTLDVVGRERLLSAIAANFSAMTVMGIVAPLVAGTVVSVFHIGWAYVIMGSAYVVSATILLNLTGVPRAPRRPGSPWRDLKEGVRYVATTPTVRALILMALVGEFFGWAHEPMMPVMARDVLGVGASGLGYLLAAASAGAMVTTVVVSNLGDIKDKSRLLITGFAGYGLFLILFASSRWFPPSMVLIALAYASVALYEVALNTLLQTIVPDEIRGRVLSFQTFAWGFTGLSGFHTGAIASRFGAPVAIALGGGVVLLNAVRLARRASTFQPQPAEPAEPVAGG